MTKYKCHTFNICGKYHYFPNIKIILFCEFSDEDQSVEDVKMSVDINKLRDNNYYRK